MTGCVIVAWLSLALNVQATACTDLPGPAVGYGASAPPRVWILRRYLDGLRRGLPGVSAFRATQVFVVAHEVGHAVGCATEHAANSWAHRHWAYVVRRLGGSAARAARLWTLLPGYWKALPGAVA